MGCFNSLTGPYEVAETQVASDDGGEGLIIAGGLRAKSTRDTDDFRNACSSVSGLVAQHPTPPPASS
ncbi:hypothetical protein NMY22_g19362 [Coprinellus aureogranulatus]|nr:hypothetical protein NMY22_g19362 [Coprinellus aureogranulatus]